MNYLSTNMKTYIVYDTLDHELPILIGSTQEVINFLNITAAHLYRAVKDNHKIKKRYIVCQE